MCDYSLHAVLSRQARVGDELTVSTFPVTTTRGLAAAGEPDTAVCLLPGTELAFAENVRSDDGWRTHAHRTARFRKIDEECVTRHHDAIELPDGTTVLMTHLVLGQRVTVLQLPNAAPLPEKPAQQLVEEAAAEPTTSEPVA